MAKKQNDTLHLVVKRKWWEMERDSIKPEDYREINLYWLFRLAKLKDKCNISAGDIINVIKAIASKRSLTRSGLIHLLNKYNLELKDFEKVCLQMGYTKQQLRYPIDDICVGYGNPDWGAPTDRPVFIIKFMK